MQKLVKTDVNNFQRDVKTRALVNINRDDFNKYKKQKQTFNELRQRISKLEKKVEILLEKLEDKTIG